MNVKIKSKVINKVQYQRQQQKKAFKSIINLKDKNGENIITAHTYIISSKKNSETKLSCLYIIMNKDMATNLINSNMQQYFADTTYHCILPTIKIFKLFIISGFNVIEKKPIYVIMH